MNIAVISDLHIGSESVTDSFGHDDGEFLRFLSFLERNFEHVVLLGDIWETLTTKCPWRARQGLAQARQRHPEIARRFLRPCYRYIHGNHDWVAAEVDRAPERWLLNADGKRLLFMHGHGHDRMLRAARRLMELGVCIGGWIQRAGWLRLYHWLDELDQKRAAVSPDARRCTFQAWAVDEAAQASADVVITGHTHVPVAAEHGRHMFLNSGSCNSGHFTFLSLATREDRYTIHHSW